MQKRLKLVLWFKILPYCGFAHHTSILTQELSNILHYSVLNECFYYRGKHILVICKQMLFVQLSGPWWCWWSRVSGLSQQLSLTREVIPSSSRERTEVWRRGGRSLQGLGCFCPLSLLGGSAVCWLGESLRDKGLWCTQGASRDADADAVRSSRCG